MLLPEGGISSLAEEYDASNTKILSLPFSDIQALLASKEITVPQIYVQDLENRTLLLEDFGDTLLSMEIKARGMEAFESALDLLCQIPNPHPKAKKDSIAFLRAFDEKLYMWEFEHFIEYGIQKNIKHASTDLDRIRNHFHKISETYLEWEKHLTHRDFHSRNIISIEKNHLGLIDFQDALMGPVYYDLVSLLKDAYVTVDRKSQERLALEYQKLLSPTLKDASISGDEFLYRFDLMSLHRNLKAAGRFVYFDQVKDNPSYLKDVPQALQYVLETLSTHSELNNLQKLLKPYLETIIEEI